MSDVQDPDWESFLRGLALRWEGYGGGEKLCRAVCELDRLRSRVAELEAAGDVLAVEASWTSLDVRCGPLDDAVSDWRAVRGEGSE